LSSKDPNLQNRKKECRSRYIYVASPGRKLLSADLSQIELRILAAECGDEDLVQIYIDGVDLHEETARNIVGGVPNGEPVPESVRTKSKRVNFGIAYLITSYGLRKQIGGTQDECQEYIDNFYNRFPGVASWQNKTKEFARRYGCAYTLFGRKRIVENARIEMRNRDDELRFEEAMRQICNSPIQGGAADILLVCVVRLRKLIRKHRIDAKMVNVVHDDIVFDVADDEVERLAYVVRQVMRKEPLRWIGKYLRGIPLDVDIKVGQCWAEMLKLKEGKS